ncbi:MAG: tetratricopeptide repeat protein [Cytophagales bacterium]|nr:tetratricopeptide repeat protein [Cytophagales bacterium]
MEDLDLYAEALSEINKFKASATNTISFCEYGIRYGNFYTRLLKYDSALYIYRKAISECGTKHETSYGAMHGIAFVHRVTGILDSSAVWEYRALELSKSKDYTYGIELSLQSLAILSYSRRNYKESNVQAFELIKILDEVKDPSLAANMYNLVAENYRNLKNLDSALLNHFHALELRRKSGNESRIASSLNNIATIYLAKSDGKSAMPYLIEARASKEKISDSISLTSIYTNLGTASYLKKEYAEARKYFEQSEAIGAAIKFTDGRLTNFPALIQLDTVMGDYKHAFNTYVIYHDVYKKYLDEAKQKELLQLDKKFETAKKDQELTLKDNQILQRERFIFWISMFILGVLLLSLYLFYLLKKNKKLSQRNELLLREQNHRVKNNLQMISSLLSLQSQKLQTSDAKEVLEDSQGRISSVALLHRMLYEGEQVGQIEVSGYLKTLTEEIKYAAGREMEITLSLPDRLELKVEQVTSLGLIVNELCVNSIKHVDRNVLLHLRLRIESFAMKLNLNYSDNGTGVTRETWMSSNSFGNQLIQLQSRQLRGEFVVSNENGFMFSLQVPK